MPEASKSSRRTMLILIAVFFLPLAGSFILYYGVKWRPPVSSRGELLTPAKQMPEDNAADMLKGATPGQRNWALMYVGDGACDEDCRKALVLARQTRLSLNKDMTRVNLVFLSTDHCCDLAYIDKEHPGLKVRAIEEPQAMELLLGVLPPGDLRHWLFIVDPLGNIVMRFDTRQEPRDLLSDMKKLLRLSHIG